MSDKGCTKKQDNKLNTYDWLCDVPDSINATDFVEVQDPVGERRHRGGRGKSRP